MSAVASARRCALPYRRRIRHAALVLFLAVSAAADMAQAATYLVTSAASAGTGSLREALTQAQAAGAGPHTVIFTLPLNSVISLATPLPALSATTLTVDGSGSPGLVIDGNDTVRVFDVGASAALSLRDLSLQRGFVDSDRGGCVRVLGSSSTLTLDRVTMQNCRAVSIQPGGLALGGAVYADGNVFVYRSRFSGNLAQAPGSIAGGALDVRRNLWIENSHFEGNGALGTGATGAAGGAVVAGTGTLTVLRSQFIGNRAVQTSGAGLSFGGALYARDRTATTVRQSLFLRNESGNGAALYASLATLPNTMTVAISNTTFAGNSSGPALHLAGTRLDLRNNSFWKNSGRSGLGAHLHASGANSSVAAATHNLFAASADGAALCSSAALPADLDGTGSNLFADTSCGYLDAFSYIEAGDLRIRGLRTTGSALHDIPVIDLFAGSPAIDAGNPDAPGSGTVFVCTAGDARDETRPADGDADGSALCDIGAHELQHEASLFADDMEAPLLR